MAYIFESRERMVRFYVPSNSIIGEVGVFKGEFAKFLHSLNPQKLILFDLFQGVTVSGDQDGNNVQYANLDDEYKNISNWALTQQNIVLEKGDSSLMLFNYPNEFFDITKVEKLKEQYNFELIDDISHGIDGKTYLVETYQTSLIWFLEKYKDTDIIQGIKFYPISNVREALDLILENNN